MATTPPGLGLRRRPAAGSRDRGRRPSSRTTASRSRTCPARSVQAALGVLNQELVEVVDAGPVAIERVDLVGELGGGGALGCTQHAADDTARPWNERSRLAGGSSGLSAARRLERGLRVGASAQRRPAVRIVTQPEAHTTTITQPARRASGSPAARRRQPVDVEAMPTPTAIPTVSSVMASSANTAPYAPRRSVRTLPGRTRKVRCGCERAPSPSPRSPREPPATGRASGASGPRARRDGPGRAIRHAARGREGAPALQARDRDARAASPQLTLRRL